MVLGSFVLLAYCIFAPQQISAQTSTTPPPLSLMEAYIALDDGAYQYEVADKLIGDGATTYIIRLVSQEWLTTNEVVDPVWWHWLTVVVPEDISTDIAMIMVGGGNRNRSQPAQTDEQALQLALGTQSIVASLHNIPNQDMTFIGDDYGPREEDELIAYGWRKYLEGGAKDDDAIWLARFPMTKAVVKAMDAVSEFTAANDEIADVKKFVISGGSKRGWTTWTAGIVDDRVVAIAPVVIDMLNMIPSFQHHWQVYGFWAPAVGNYVAEGIMEWQHSEEYDRLNAETEPYQFRERLTLPKLIINAAGDQFFLPDSWKFYWHDLVGEKHIRYVPNADHSLRGSDVFETLASFYQYILADQARPDFDWKVVNGQIKIQTQPGFVPQKITLWQAHNPEKRDFRLETIGAAYKATEIPLSENGSYTISIDEPTSGFSAFFAELQFAGLGPIPLKMTTGIVVTPDRYDHEAFESESPMGTRK